DTVEVRDAVGNLLAEADAIDDVAETPGLMRRLLGRCCFPRQWLNQRLRTNSARRTKPFIPG
ncbi:MAG: hypothetical protein ACKOPM_14415, partial [Novosphingobium sp.]